MNKFIAIAIFSAATAALSACGGKEDTEETVESIKNKLVGKWEAPSFTFLFEEIPSKFKTTTCDTLTSPDFEPFDYNVSVKLNTTVTPIRNDTTITIEPNAPLFVPLLTSITFEDDVPGLIKATFGFESCNISFTENLSVVKHTTNSDYFDLSGIIINEIDDKGLFITVFSAGVAVNLRRAD